jgi:hypothetical protein
MRYLSVCSGIEAATVATKVCAKCGETRRLTEFHRQPTGPSGRHSWCKPCANAAQKASRLKHGRPERKAAWNAASRYGLNKEDHEAMVRAHGGACGICARPMNRVCIDHDHVTGKVRGLLCHRCNIRLSGVEDDDFRTRALAYLARHA